MSVSITVHERQQAAASSNPLGDLESVRKIETEKLRLRRLEQVRQQSKEVAAKVRRKYKAAKEKELANVNKRKKDELRAWKQRHVRNLQSEYERCIGDVGEAHKAADAAEECEIWFQERKAAQQSAALLRGRKADECAAKERQERKRQKESKKRKAYVPSKSVAVQAFIPEPQQVKPVMTVQGEDEDSMSSANTLSAFEQFRQRAPATLKADARTEPVKSASLESLLSSDTEQPLYDSGKNKENIPMGHLDRGIVKQNEKAYDPSTFASPELLPMKAIKTDKDIPLKPFTQITDFIQRRRHQHQILGAKPDTSYCYTSQKAVQFDDLSENTLSFPTSSALTDRPPAVMARDLDTDGSPRKPVRKLVEKPKSSPVEMVTMADGKRRAPSAPSATESTTSYGTSSKVQYYDYNTKYRKEYDQPTTLVQRIERTPDEPNAMEEAARYEKLQIELANARKQPIVDRTKVALQKQQIRKDYDKLSAQLDNLTRAENKLKSKTAHTKPASLTETAIKQRAEARDRKATEAVEELIKKRVLITCPVVRDPPAGVLPTSRPSEVNVAGLQSVTHDQSKDSINTSDSCSSILLETGRPGMPLPLQHTTDRVTIMVKLLEQLDEQKRLLTEELGKETVVQQETVVDAVVAPPAKTDNVGPVENEKLLLMMQKQHDLETQQKLLQTREKEILELEKQLKEKMQCLEQERRTKRVIPKVHVETKGGGADDVHVERADGKPLSSSTETGSVESGTDIPVKIVITVSGDKTPKKKKKRKVKPPKETKVGEELKRKPLKDVKSVSVDAEKEDQIMRASKAPQRYEPFAKPRKPVVEHVEYSPGSSATSTIYRDLPSKIDNRVGGLLKKVDKEKQNEKISVQTTTKQSEAEASLPTALTKLGSPKYKLKRGSVQPKGGNFNPTLMRYIVRLLGMSRQSIEQLGVSSSSVSTPHDSVVNVSANRSAAESSVSYDESRMIRLQQFIDDNYNFLQEVDDTLKDSQLSGTMDENVNHVEDIWMHTLKRKEHGLRNARRKREGKPAADVPLEPVTATNPPAPDPAVSAVASPSLVDNVSPVAPEQPLKSILKSPKRAPLKVAKIITPHGHVEVINLSDREEQQILDKYSQLTENCNRRIAELSEMINTVREEKRKLIENSLSSSEQQESTKYMDLPPHQTVHRGPRPASVNVDQSSPQSARDDPASEEIDNIFSSKQIGLSKDSGIAMSRPVTSSDIRDSPDARPGLHVASSSHFASSEDVSTREPPFEPLLRDIPRPAASLLGAVETTAKLPISVRKPPVAITRFSPQLDEVPAHELSTILEVETPAASKLNISVPSSGKVPEAAEQLLIETREKLLQEAANLGYDRFPNYEEYVRQENLHRTRFDPEKTSLSRLNDMLNVTDKSEALRYQKFTGTLPPLDVSEEPVGTDGRDQNVGSASTSSASLPDVVAELKLRNIISKSFDNSLDDSNCSTPLSMASTTHDSPKKSPERRKPTRTEPSTAPLPSQDEAESLERVLSNIGLGWASAMLKKNSKTVQQDQSSSSSTSLVDDMRRSGRQAPKALDDLSSASSGKPVNLREFIARELMVRTQSDLNTLSDSSNPSSMMLRSLLNISNINTSTPELHTQMTDKNVQRTSTPVATKSSVSTPREQTESRGGEASSGANVSAALFSGESRISSVHLSSSSSGAEGKPCDSMRVATAKMQPENCNTKNN